MFATFELEVRGEQHPNPDGTSRHPDLEQIDNGDEVLLVADPYNAYDKHAVEVRNLAGRQLGFIRADQAEWFNVYAISGWVTASTVKNKWWGDETTSWHIWLDVTVRQPKDAAVLLEHAYRQARPVEIARPLPAEGRTALPFGKVIAVSVLIIILLIITR